MKGIVTLMDEVGNCVIYWKEGVMTLVEEVGNCDIYWTGK